MDEGINIQSKMINKTRIFFSGICAGITLNISMLLTFRLIGFGWNGNGILLNPEIQSEKLIAVWTEINPIPLIVNNPLPMIFGLIIFGIIHAFIYYWLSRCWPEGILSRSLRFGSLIFLLCFLFWEFFTPFNMFGEPFYLIIIELIFWAIIAYSEALVLASIIER
ncbi:MAG: hypothetical protein ACMUIU_18110 [bacterium]